MLISVLDIARKILALANPLLWHALFRHNFECMTRANQQQEKQHVIQLRGINYSPRQIPDPSRNGNPCKTVELIRKDFEMLVQLTKEFHLYSLAECSQAEIIIPIAREMGFKLFLNIWVDGSRTDDPEGSFYHEMKKLEFLLDQNLIDSNTILAFSVGSESYHRHETNMDENLFYLEIVREKLRGQQQNDFESIPLTITDIDKTYSTFDNLLSAVDFASVNAFPFFDDGYGKESSDGAVDYLIERVIDPLVEKSYNVGKFLTLTETGW